MENIYALYYEYADERRYFYVGRTNDPKRRLGEHRSNVKNTKHREDVYQFIRERCQPNGIDVWNMEVLVTEANQRPEDCEDFWVVKMIRDGYDLKNMKHGDLHRVALTMLAKRQGEFENVSEFIDFRERVDKEIKEELAAYERSRRLKESVLEESLNPNLDIQALLAAVSANRSEADRKATERRKKKEAHERAKAIEKNEWIKRMNLLHQKEEDRQQVFSILQNFTKQYGVVLPDEIVPIMEEAQQLFRELGAEIETIRKDL